MSFVKSIFGKKGKKDESGIPKIYNALFSFTHKGIIEKSQESEQPLNGSKSSDTLYTESDFRTEEIGFIFTNSLGCKIISNLQDRLENLYPNSTLFARKKDFETIQSKIAYMELPEKTTEELTFYQGTKWYNNNTTSINQLLDRSLRGKSLVFLFVDNDAFLIGLITRITEYLISQGTQPVLILQLPLKTVKPVEEFTVLTYIQKLMQQNVTHNIPFILIDMALLHNANAFADYLNLYDLFINRLSNLIADISLMVHTPSIFYQYDLSNFVRIFKEAKGPCKLLSYDIYDDKSDISSLLKKKSDAESFISKQDATRGFLGLQLSDKGLKTTTYKEIRKFYSNKDIDISIMPERRHGGIVRGIFSFNEVPKAVLDRYDTLETLSIEILDSSYNPIEIFDFIDHSKIWEIEYFRINIKKEEK